MVLSPAWTWLPHTEALEHPWPPPRARPLPPFLSSNCSLLGTLSLPPAPLHCLEDLKVGEKGEKKGSGKFTVVRQLCPPPSVVLRPSSARSLGDWEGQGGLTCLSTESHINSGLGLGVGVTRKVFASRVQVYTRGSSERGASVDGREGAFLPWRSEPWVGSKGLMRGSSCSRGSRQPTS